MRTSSLLLALVPLALATPGWAYRLGAIEEADRLIREHRLLTPEERACSDLIRGPQAVGEAVQVMVVARRAPQCPPVAPASAHRFDIFLDFRSGAAQWNGYGPAELTDIPATLGDPRPFCLPAGPCLNH